MLSLGRGEDIGGYKAECIPLVDSLEASHNCQNNAALITKRAALAEAKTAKRLLAFQHFINNAITNYKNTIVIL